MPNGEKNNNWINLLAVDDIPVLGSRVFSSSEGPIAIFRTLEDAVFAIHDECPHKGGPLSQGIVHGTSVTCPLHSWNIDLNTGCAVAPDEGCVKHYPIRIEAGRVFISLEDKSLADA
jgi:nitrite reductase (NADH) small subunit